MGMFDSFRCEDPRVFICGDGHDLVGHELQSKDLDCELLVYTIKGKRLLLNGKRIDHNGSLNLYTHCHVGRPRFAEGKYRNGQTFYQRLDPWQEWDCWFENGRLRRIKPVQLEKRADCTWGGDPALPDDDPNAIEQTNWYIERGLWRAQ